MGILLIVITGCQKSSPKKIDPKTIMALEQLQSSVNVYFSEHEGVWPTSLDILVPKYISEIPSCKTPWHGEKIGTTIYTASVTTNASIDASKIGGTGKWGYVMGSNTSDDGLVFIDAKEVNSLALTTLSADQAISQIYSALNIYMTDQYGHSNNGESPSPPVTPEHLENLIPRYLRTIPPCLTKEHGTQVGTISFQHIPTTSELQDSGKWGYIAGVSFDELNKAVFIDCIHWHKPIPLYNRETLLGNLGAIRSSIAIFYGDSEGKYPISLDLLVPRYLPDIPLCITKQHGAQRGILIYDHRPKNAQELRDTGQWAYVPTDGEFFISSLEEDIYLK